jgi:hypothetical protein
MADSVSGYRALQTMQLRAGKLSLESRGHHRAPKALERPMFVGSYVMHYIYDVFFSSFIGNDFALALVA